MRFARSLAPRVLETHSQMLCSDCGREDEFREENTCQEDGGQSRSKRRGQVDRLRARFDPGSEPGDANGSTRLHGNAIQAAKNVGVKRILYTSHQAQSLRQRWRSGATMPRQKPCCKPRRPLRVAS